MTEHLQQRQEMANHPEVLGLAQSLANLAVYKHRNSFDFFNTIGVKVMKITAVWGWSMFFVNSALTTLILAKIMFVPPPHATSSY